MFHFFKTTASDSLPFNGFWTMDLVIFKLVVWSQTVCTEILVVGPEGARLRKVAPWIRHSVQTKEKLAMQPWPWKLPRKSAEFCSLSENLARVLQHEGKHVRPSCQRTPGGGRESLAPGRASAQLQRGLCCKRGGQMGRNWPTWRDAQVEPWQSPRFFYSRAPRDASAASVSFHAQPPWNPAQWNSPLSTLPKIRSKQNALQ